jgi:hypothetical protein
MASYSGAIVEIYAFPTGLAHYYNHNRVVFKPYPASPPTMTSLLPTPWC